ncbi:MAG: TlpA family protein disulfide reductase [Verrucomicrobiales bacterium]|nr:TlpA family protein disulfide reductase [Verrucomicrobiales bacterium]
MKFPAVRPILVLPLLAASLLRPCAAPEPPTDFSVQSPVDQSVFRLSDARGQFVVLHFLLKTECPYCLRHTREYLRRAAELPQVQQVFLKPDSDQEILKWIQSAGTEPGKTPPIYRDPDARLAEAYGIPGGYSFHGEKVHYPALILLDTKGGEVFRHVGKDNSDRYGFDALAARIAALKAAPPRKPAP